jgi:hypothetical protein
MAPRNNPTESHMFAMFDAIAKRTGYWPVLLDARRASYPGQDRWFYQCQRKWGATLTDKPPKRNNSNTKAAINYMPADLEAEAVAQRTHTTLTPETQLKEGRPIERPEDQMSVAELAVKQYRDSWKHLREAGA